MDLGSIIDGLGVVDVLLLAAAPTAVAVISEVLPYVSKVKANSTIQLVSNILKVLISLLKKKTK